MRDTRRILTLGVYNVCARADVRRAAVTVSRNRRTASHRLRATKASSRIESDREKYKVYEVYTHIYTERERKREKVRAILAVQLGTPQIFNRHPLDHHPPTTYPSPLPPPRLILRPSLPPFSSPSPPTLFLYSSSFLPRPPPDQWGC